MLDALFSGTAVWFSVPALLGSAFYLMRVVLLLIGAGDHGGLDHPDVGAGDVHHGDSGGAFAVVSTQAVAAFLMGFGWSGLVALHATDGRWPIVGVIAVAIAGGCVVWLIQAALLRSMMRLQTSGNISIQQALGSVGTVYTLVPAPGRGSGQVRLVVDGRQRIFGAVSQGPELASQTRVKVIKVNDDNTLVVAPAD